MLEVSVVIPCFDRLELLERTLRACFGQVVPEGLGWEVIVADNHPDRLSAGLVAALAAEAPMPLLHVPAGVRNIAQARNLGVAAAQGRFVAFVDDDEAPEPGWLEAHHACLERTGADASFGPKFPVYEGGAAPDWDPQGWFYTVDFGMAEDAEIRPLDWWPPRGRGLGTGNSMLRVATCLSEPPAFDEVFGRSGGEDTRLFLGLAKRGRRYVWCGAARVIEYNEASRLTASYMSGRVRRSARHSAEVRLAISDHRLWTQAGTMAIGLAQLGVYGTLYLATRRPKYAVQMSKGAGKLGFAQLEFLKEDR
jgi:glycosyltransferase involved in cell wall biosynthesis